MSSTRKKYLKLINLRNREHRLREQQMALLGDIAVTAPSKMFVNKGEEDEMEIFGYKKSTVKTIFTYIFIFLSGGLLRLIFHWVPHWLLKATCYLCPVPLADKVLIIDHYKGKHKNYHVKPLQFLSPFSSQKDVVLEDEHQYKNNMITRDGDIISDVKPKISVQFEPGIFKNVDRVVMFKYKKFRYVYDAEKGKFVKLQGLDKGVTSDFFYSCKGLTESEQFMRRQIYGNNEIAIEESSVFSIMFLEILNPFYVFQIFSFALWFADAYYYYAAAILLMSVYGIAATVIQTRRNQHNLKSTVHSSDVVTVVRKKPKNFNVDDTGKEHETISTELLVPGDVIVIPPHGCILHCDALLLTGNCILNESMLTGESVPVTKTPFPNLPHLVYDPKEHSKHTLFCGTQVIQTRYFGDEHVLAVVIRTGYSTSKGGLVRSILYPPPVDYRFEKDSYRFILVLALIAGVGFLYTIVTKFIRGIALKEIVIEALDLITIVVPPALPAAMTVGSLSAQTRLKNNQIYCISPRTINVTGSIDCVCFDKTGTLTEDGLDLLCVVPVGDKKFATPIENVGSMPQDTFFFGLASCHSLTIIDKNITGDPLDVKMFESTKWILEEHETSDSTKFNMLFPSVVKPPSPIKIKSDLGEYSEEFDLQVGIIREFPFSSSSQRMGVIIRKLGAPYFEYYCKGSPEMILTFVKPQTIPEDFNAILNNYTQDGCRVIAMAHKQLKISYAKVQRVQREVLEVDMDFMGLIVLENRLKPQTMPCIQVLNEAKIRIIMITGDNILTAVSVGRDCGIIAHNQSVITIECDDYTGTVPRIYYYFSNPSKGTKSITNMSFMSNSASIVSLDTVESQLQTVRDEHSMERPVIGSIFNNYRLALTGKVWQVMKDHYPELIPRIVTRGTIFARMSPEQKQQLVEELQGLGYCVAMCGDGANDCGALRAAHAGISLSDAESSVASPFTSKISDISCVLKIIKEGRAALVTNFGIFKYMASYSLCQFISVMILYSIDSNLTDIEFLYIDLFIISVFAFLFGKTESYSGKLVKETPLSSLLSLSPLLSLFLQMLLVVLFQVTALQHLKSQEWYVPFNSTARTDENDIGCTENYAIFTVSSFQYIILAVVFSKGKPYRKSVFSNYLFVSSAVILTLFSIYLALYPADFLIAPFQLIIPENFLFRIYMILYAVINFVLSLFVETVIIDNIVFKKLRFKFHNVDKSKRKYLAVERDLHLDTKWPPLSTHFRSAASPMDPSPPCTAEIVIEKENKFGRHHVLNSLYEDSSSSSFRMVSSSDRAHLNQLSPSNTTDEDDSSDVFQSAGSISPSTPLSPMNNNCFYPKENKLSEVNYMNGVISASSPERGQRSDLEMKSLAYR